MAIKLTEKQNELLDKIQRDVIFAKCNIEALKLCQLNGLAKEQWIDSIYELLFTARNNAKTLWETTEKKA